METTLTRTGTPDPFFRGWTDLDSSHSRSKDPQPLHDCGTDRPRTNQRYRIEHPDGARERRDKRRNPGSHDPDGSLCRIPCSLGGTTDRLTRVRARGNSRMKMRLSRIPLQHIER